MPPRKLSAAEPGDEMIKVITLQRLGTVTLEIPVEGVTPVIPHRWAEKSLKLMRDKQMAEPGSLGARRQPKNPDEEAEQSCYWLDVAGERHAAVPAVAFKAAMCGAVRFYEGITLVQAKSLFFVEGTGDEQLVPLNGTWKMREDTPRNSGGTADLRYRMAVSVPWSAVLRVVYKKDRISAESIFALADAAGSLGVGDWRPNSPKSLSGTYGQFRVAGD
jgi:hypothetical protein